MNLKTLFKKNKKAKKDIFEKGEFNLKNIEILKSSRFMVSLLYANDFVDTIYPACAACYGITANKDYQQRVDYIGRRVSSSHTSILEHSNVIVQAYIALTEDNRINAAFDHNPYIKYELCDTDDSNQDILSMISEVRDVCRYLAVHTDYIDDGYGNPIMKMTIGGSIRGFRYIFEHIENRQNRLFLSIFNVLKLSIPEEFFLDFVNDEAMNSYSIISVNKKLQENIKTKLLNEDSNDKIDIINMDNLDHISKVLQLPKDECLDFVSITVNFKNMSRIITQQVTRHRNAITQESQRYVNYSNAKFNSPALFKDKYDPNKKYNTPFGDYTLQELGDFMSGVYECLVSQGVEKEDARGYLPANSQCGKLFMTFTLRTLLVFLNLRLDKHAQAEVRQYAEILAQMTNKLAIQLNNGDVYTMQLASELYTQPAYRFYESEDYDYYQDIDEEV